MNLFVLFGLEESPLVDKSAAAKKYLELQKKYHPDFYTNESEEEKENALEQSAAINRAYNIFKDADKTLEYFLQQNGMIATDEKYALPPDFLMEMMELNESFDEDETAIKDRVSNFEQSLNEEVSPLLESGRKPDFTAAELQQLKSYYYRKKYLKRILARTGD